jgi:hypothetical protein
LWNNGDDAKIECRDDNVEYHNHHHAIIKEERTARTKGMFIVCFCLMRALPRLLLS